jgi:hypothetical protein
VAHVLHLVKDPANRLALDVIRAQAGEPDTRVTIVLLDAARALAEPLPGHVYQLRLEAPAEAAGDPGRPAIGPSELLDLVFEADSVVAW